MDLLISSLLCLLLSWVLFQLLKRNKFRRARPVIKLPPGPRRIPIFGNLLDLGDKPHKSMAELAKTHGPLMSLKLGNLITIVVSSPDMAKEIMQKHDLTFSNRTTGDAVRAKNHHEVGLPWIPVSTLWRTLRKVCNSHIFTTQKLDANQYLRRNKVQQLLAKVEESCRRGEAINIGQAAFDTSLNLMSNTNFSVDLVDPNSTTGQEFKKTVTGIMEDLGRPNLADYFPVLRQIDPVGVRRRTEIHFGKLIELFDRMFDERMDSRKAHSYTTTNDVLDTLIDITEDKTQELISKEHIMHLFVVLFVAGTDTTSSTLEWAMAELLINPKLLLKAQAELEQVIGKGKQVEESDVARLPYLQAIVKETFRMHPVIPLMLPRRAGGDVEICGFTVPKDAQILVNAWAIGRDPSVWENPNCFKPERFLVSDIDVRGRNFELITFGGGRRICPGLPLAIRMLHLMLGSLIHSFDWRLEDGVTPESMSMEDKFGLSLQKAEPLRAIPIPK